MIHVDEFAASRDPRNACVGYHIQDTYGCADCCYKWFDSLDDLTDHLINVELRLCLWPAHEHADFQARFSENLTGVVREGLSDKAQQDWVGDPAMLP